MTVQGFMMTRELKKQRSLLLMVEGYRVENRLTGNKEWSRFCGMFLVSGVYYVLRMVHSTPNTA